MMSRFQEYYTTHDLFDDTSNVAIIGTTQSGLMYMGLPLVIAALLKWPWSKRYMSPAGLFLICVSLIAASFAQRVAHLIMTQGVLYAVGGCMLYGPLIVWLDDWFIKRKGFAFGVVVAGTGVAGIVLPFVINWALPAYGFRTVLRAWSLLMFVLVLPLLWVIKPRRDGSNVVVLHFDFLKSGMFNAFQLGNILEALGFFLPQVYLPTYAKSLGATSTQSTLTLVVFNTMSVVGCVIMGTMIDRFDVTLCILTSSVGAAVGVLVFWGCTTALPTLYVFCAIYGLFAGGFSSTWPGVMGVVSKRVTRAEPGMVFAMLSAGKGLGSVVSGPLSERLLDSDTWNVHGKLAYNSEYGPLIIFTGMTALLGSLGLCTKLWKGIQ